MGGPNGQKDRQGEGAPPASAALEKGVEGAKGPEGHRAEGSEAPAQDPRPGAAEHVLKAQELADLALERHHSFLDRLEVVLERVEILLERFPGAVELIVEAVRGASAAARPARPASPAPLPRQRPQPPRPAPRAPLPRKLAGSAAKEPPPPGPPPERPRPVAALRGLGIASSAARRRILLAGLAGDGSLDDVLAALGIPGEQHDAIREIVGHA